MEMSLETGAESSRNFIRRRINHPFGTFEVDENEEPELGEIHPKMKFFISSKWKQYKVTNHDKP